MCSTLLGLKLPELFCCYGRAGLARRARRRISPANTAAAARAILFAVALAAVLPIAVTVIARPAMYNGIRHFVFVLPPLAVAGGLAGAWIANWIAQHGGRLRRPALAALAVIFAAGVALPAIGMARLHPYEYVYFNHLGGGVRGAQPRFMLDYWGLAFKQAGKALRAKLAARGETPPAGRKWTDRGVRPASVGARVALGDQFEPTWDPKGADFALMLGVFYCAKLDAPLLGRDRARRRQLRARLRHSRPYDFKPVHPAAGAAGLGRVIPQSGSARLSLSATTSQTRETPAIFRHRARRAG